MHDIDPTAAQRILRSAEEAGLRAELVEGAVRIFFTGSNDAFEARSGDPATVLSAYARLDRARLVTLGAFGRLSEKCFVDQSAEEVSTLGAIWSLVQLLLPKRKSRQEPAATTDPAGPRADAEADGDEDNQAPISDDEYRLILSVDSWIGMGAGRSLTRDLMNGSPEAALFGLCRRAGLATLPTADEVRELVSDACIAGDPLRVETVSDMIFGHGDWSVRQADLDEAEERLGTGAGDMLRAMSQALGVHGLFASRSTPGKFITDFTDGHDQYTILVYSDPLIRLQRRRLLRELGPEGAAERLLKPFFRADRRRLETLRDLRTHFALEGMVRATSVDRTPFGDAEEEYGKEVRSVTIRLGSTLTATAAFKSRVTRLSNLGITRRKARRAIRSEPLTPEHRWLPARKPSRRPSLPSLDADAVENASNAAERHLAETRKRLRDTSTPPMRGGRAQSRINGLVLLLNDIRWDPEIDTWIDPDWARETALIQWRAWKQHPSAALAIALGADEPRAEMVTRYNEQDRLVFGKHDRLLAWMLREELRWDMGHDGPEALLTRWPDLLGPPTERIAQAIADNHDRDLASTEDYRRWHTIAWLGSGVRSMLFSEDHLEGEMAAARECAATSDLWADDARGAVALARELRDISTVEAIAARPHLDAALFEESHWWRTRSRDDIAELALSLSAAGPHPIVAMLAMVCLDDTLKEDDRESRSSRSADKPEPADPIDHSRLLAAIAWHRCRTAGVV